MNESLKSIAPIKIALCGMGAAGSARLKALKNMPRFEVAGLISRRSGIGTLSLEEALADNSLDAVAISTENTNHAKIASLALEAKKHVLCDYPLALSADEAKKLVRLATKYERILHTEHIALLTQSHKTLKEQIPQLGLFKRGRFTFTAGLERYNPEHSGPFALQAESRLLQLVDLFGEMKVLDGGWHLGTNSGKIWLKLQCTGGGILEMEEIREMFAQRKRTLVAEFEKGRVQWPEKKDSFGLFAEDLQWFEKQIAGASSSYYKTSSMLGVLEMLENLPRQHPF